MSEGFFAIDNRVWPKVCQLGLNEGVAYLVLARGTGRDNRTTAWSSHAVERYTGISRYRAAAALDNLRAKRFVGLLRGETRPKYELIPFCELKKRDPALIWLPNELVTGASDEIPPLELVRRTQDAMTLRLFIEMYHASNLREDGGVSRQFIWKSYDRLQVGQQGQFVVWGFREDRQWVRFKKPLTMPHRRKKGPTDEERAQAADFLRRWDELISLGLIEWVPHLVESAKESSGIIHPLEIAPVGTDRHGSIEDRLGRAADAAGRALITEGQYEWALAKGVDQLVPVPFYIGKVAMVGIARLRYRPKTRMTGAWWVNLHANAEKHIGKYGEMAALRATRASV